MKYTVRLNISGTVEKTVEAEDEEEAEAIAQEWWADMDAYTVADHVSVDEIDVEKAR